MKKTTITIVGGGTAGWITASILSKGLPSAQYHIRLIESPDIPTVGVGEATIPPILQLAQFLEIAPNDMLKAIDGTYKFGIHFENWSNIGESYIHAFGYLQPNYGQIDFGSLWTKYRAQLELPPLHEFIPAGVAAYENKFAMPALRPANAQPQHFFPLTELHHAYHFDAGLLAEFLKNYAIDAGIEFISATIQDVSTDPNGVTSVSTEQGEFASDYFVDCSGGRGLLIKQTLNAEFENWQDNLPCDSAVVAQTALKTSPIPYTKSIGMSSGWRWQIPLTTRCGNGYVYASRFIDDETAKQEFVDALSNEEIITEPRVIKFTTGCLTTPWLKNVVAIGLSSGFLEPLESTSIHMTHKYALELMNAFRYGSDMTEEATRFNGMFYQDCLSIRDFLVAHYCTSQRDDSEFWRYCTSAPLPETLQAILSQYKDSGDITLPEGALFVRDSWLQVLTGQHYYPNTVTFDSSVTESQAKQFFTNVRNAVRTEVAKLPTHEQALKTLHS